ncbi:MAG TPA: V-type ATP synthase subunit E [Soehngenia sp.]|nr:V-type ATP synthase subunit E [Soehngenia sp.]
MITVEDKLDIFRKVVYKEEEKKFQKALEELKKENDNLLEKKKKELEAQRDEIIKRKLALAEREINEKISEEKTKVKEKVLKMRAEILQDFLESLYLKASEFTKTSEYRQYLFDKLDKAILELGDMNFNIYVRESDKDIVNKHLAETYKNRFDKFNIETMPSNLIGGFLIEDQEKTFLIDYSLKTLIDDNEYEIGNKLFSLLERAGDINE